MADAMKSMAESLRAINERLQHIEGRMGPELPVDAMKVESPAASSPHGASADSDRHGPEPALDLGDGSNAVQVIVEEMSRIEARTGEMSLDQVGARKVPNTCDALLRGLVTVAEVDLAFNFFIERINPWTDTLARESDRKPLVLRNKSPFLFSVILLVTNYYNTSKTDRALEVYRGLTEVVKLLLGAAILSPTAVELNTEFVIALLLLIHYKPGMYDLGQIVHASKVNPLSSMMIHGLMHRTSSYLGIPNSAHVYLTAVAGPGPTPLEATTNLRVWYWLCIADIHGSLQSGRPCQTDPTAALQTTRHFAEARVLPTDPRRAATFEGYAIARTPVDAHSTSQIRLSQLQRCAEDFDRWQQYWPPVLQQAQQNGDPLAYTGLTTFYFATLSTMSTVYTRWANERKKSLAEGGNGRPVLSTPDWTALQRAADSCQQMIYSVSVESASGGNVLRNGNWPGSPQGYRESFNRLDTVTCVSFVYALLLLVKMASAVRLTLSVSLKPPLIHLEQGLISCDLQCLRLQYEAGVDLDVPQPLTVGLKLPRLLLLGSQFLKGISPQPEHPAYKHGELIELILEAGLGVDTPHSSSSPPARSPGPVPSTVPHVVIPYGVDLNPPPIPLGPSVESWLDALAGPSTAARRTTDAAGPPAPPGEAMRTLLDDISTTYHEAPVPNGASGDWWAGQNFDGMMVDWSAIASSWEEK
ncbi:hypothetical protein RQP46_000525 [Phenoliferia psychrophenolica]